MKTLVILFAIVIGLIRPFLLCVELNPHLQKSYEAAAHILIGGLFTCYFMWRRYRRAPRGVVVTALYTREKCDDFTWALQLAVILTIVETICAGISVLT